MKSSKRPGNFAEDRYRAAFERLKTNKPEILLPNTPVTQNNVAREAGQDPSALKKSRFPNLINDIQEWVIGQRDLTTRTVQKNAASKKDYREKYIKMREQRDRALQLLVEADAMILDLSNKLEEINRSIPPTNIARLLSDADKQRKS